MFHSESETKEFYVKLQPCKIHFVIIEFSYLAFYSIEFQRSGLKMYHDKI